MPFLAAIPALVGSGLAAVGGGSALAGAAGAVSSIAGAVGGARGHEQSLGERMQLQGFNQLQSAVDAGPGTADIQAGAQGQRDLAAELERLRTQGTGPTTEDIASQQSLAGRLFRQRQVGLQQSFIGQRQQFEQAAARMGRSPLDPVFRNKLAEQETQAEERLGAEQSVFATQQAQAQPFQRLQLQQSRAELLGGLASQAMANRQALASAGSGLGRVQEQGAGGGLGGAVAGGLRGFGSGLAAGAQAQQLFRGAPQAGQEDPTNPDYFNKYANPANR